jgi:lipopolysaccharide export system protein LptA
MLKNTTFHIIVTVILMFFSTLEASSQVEGTPGKILVKIVKADKLRHDDKIGKNTQSLIGDVQLRHVNTILNCDSAYMFNDSNIVHAYGKVHIIQNDSIHLYSEYLEYEGNKNLAKMRRNVKANKGTTWLYTQYLDYDRAADMGYFFNGGKVEDKNNVLTSTYGYYYPNTNEVFFKDSVVTTTPDYRMYGDTMRYNTATEVVRILGPTNILGDSVTMYSENGYYDTKNDFARLLKNNNIVGKEHTLAGDTIFYNRRTGEGEVFGNMALSDTTNNIIIKGNYGFYNEITKYALATKRAEMLQISGIDTLFMHADTMLVDPLPLEQSRILRAYRNVKFFRYDMQGRCDSLIYDFRDSTSVMFNTPVVWAQGNQLTAQQLKLYTRNNALYKAELLNSAYIIAPEDTTGYNQVKGKNMTGYIKNNELYKVDVDGNAQTVYYPKDKEQLIGINRGSSSNMTINMKNKKIQQIIMRVSPSGNLNPLSLLAQDETTMKGFVWLEQYRPKQRSDIFLKLEIPQTLEQTNEFEGYEFTNDL